MNLSNRLRVLRIKKGLSQEDLAANINEKTGADLKRNTISNYENGVSNPDYNTLRALIEILDTTANYLLNISPFAHITEGDTTSVANEDSAFYQTNQQAFIFDSMKRFSEIKGSISHADITKKQLKEYLEEMLDLNEELAKKVMDLYERNIKAIDFINSQVKT